MLADPSHKTNVHAHYKVPYHAIHDGSIISTAPLAEGEISKQTSRRLERSFFNMSYESRELFQPVNPEVHGPMSVSQFLSKKLRWLTLGAQYDWTNKTYSNTRSPPFPEELAAFTQQIFPGMNPEAAIVNLYSPGDTLSVHRDVSEESDTGLVSVSLGCDGIFVAGTEEEDGRDPKVIAVRLRSGDAVYMCGPSRFFWHGVPRIIANTCPDWLKGWPAEENSHTYDEWKGWMSEKRINLNMRQVSD